MNLLNDFIQNKEQIITLLIEHIYLTIISVGCAILIAIPLGIIISYKKKLSKPILSIANIVQAIPSMALLGFLIPFLGIGKLPAIVTVVMYSLLPIIKNTYTGLESINPSTLEAAKGIGLTKFQILMKIQIPLALPVIMAGVRISAVTAVGLMTMAAFIGAGGLGYLVFSGIRTVNNSQILQGAIPACLLALVVDFVFATIEKLVTPKNIQKNVSNKNKKYKRAIISLGSIMVVIALIISSINSGVKKDKVITIGGKDFTEQSILTNLVAYMIEENTDISVDKKTNLGSTQVIFSALNNGDIDMYLEYMGSAYSDILKYSPINDMDKIYNTVKSDLKAKHDLEVLSPMSFNNTFALAVTKETAEKYNLETISDFAKVSKNFRAGTTFEFLNREDGLLGLKKEYNFDLKSEIALDSSPRYIALNNGDVDVIDAFTTDGLIKKFDLKLLEDDKQFFPPYYVIPVIKSDVLNKYPEIEPLLKDLGEVLTDEIMMELNYKVDELHMDPDVVAKDFLIEKGLIK
ncbi:glycine betaine ABC transporter substrate-binding protein [Paraclostridium ghonii]|uniref:Osmoprotectant transport system permease protein n=1 Tax=Paraclostridium ghonii TaxID=29358 RepID=A0ABU0MZC6_9FIRM|nr:glycine betaine ABC transporter substrate-binding protein [Paeniclostridium ghonii]MDQ0556261.1 osmoprotectant transport system permease protein [Paeniclostridium ghonii]